LARCFAPDDPLLAGDIGIFAKKRAPPADFNNRALQKKAPPSDDGA
jgi:hypothetical protein